MLGPIELIIIVIAVAFLVTQSRKTIVTLCACAAAVIGVVALLFSIREYRSAELPNVTATRLDLLQQFEIGESPAAEVDEEWPEEIKLSHAELDLSTIPEGHPEWVDETAGVWNPENKIWSTTVMIGPYETEDECEEHFRKHVREAVVEFADWRGAQLTDVGYYDPEKLPLPEANLNFNHGTKRRSGNDGAYELRTFNKGSVSQTYHTKSNTGVSDEPWPVVFARVEFDRDFQRKVDRHLLHGRSISRALKAGTVWGVTLLGMVLALGGLKLTESSSQAATLDALAAAPTSEPPSESTTSAAEDLARKRGKLILAPVICTAIYFMTVGNPDGLNGFWPMWVWFGCGIGLITTFKPFRYTKKTKKKNRNA